jgi:hypothetical protein
VAVCDDDSGKSRGVAGWLSLAATPSFAVMAVVTGLSASAPMMNCMAMPEASALSLGGMVPMYLLMSVFHAAPWVRLMTLGKKASPQRRSRAE